MGMYRHGISHPRDEGAHRHARHPVPGLHGGPRRERALDRPRLYAVGARMKYMSAGLTTYLNSLGPGVSPMVADLLTIAPVSGSVVRLTSAPVTIKSTSL